MLLDGKKLAAEIRAATTAEAQELKASGIDPTLALVIATDDDSTAWYVRSLKKAAEKVGVATKSVDLGPQATEREIADTLQTLGADGKVHGIILQTPLPNGVGADALVSQVPPEKDVDGANPLSAGRLLAGLPAFAPATAAAVMEILTTYNIPLEGRHAVVIGRSMIVGKPVAHLLLEKNATVTICHSRTNELPLLASAADIIVAAVGKPALVDKSYVNDQSVVIDVGTTQDENGKLVGDVNPDIQESVAAMSPVPGGVGPVTTALLLRNTIRAAQRSQ